MSGKEGDEPKAPETVVIPEIFACDLIRTTEIPSGEVIAVQALRHIVNELNNGLGVLLGLTHNVLEYLEDPEPRDEHARLACRADLRSAQEKIKSLSILMPQAKPRRAQLPKQVNKGYALPEDTTILLVDDDFQLRPLLEKILRESGFTVIEVAGSYEAMKVNKRQNRIDVLVTDLNMPDITGSELADYLHLARPDLKVIFMSGVMPETFDPDAVLLIKPFPLHALVAAVRDTLAR